jgi:hypothetical protein
MDFARAIPCPIFACTLRLLALAHNDTQKRRAASEHTQTPGPYALMPFFSSRTRSGARAIDRQPRQNCGSGESGRHAQARSAGWEIRTARGQAGLPSAPGYCSRYISCTSAPPLPVRSEHRLPRPGRLHCLNRTASGASCHLTPFSVF